MKHAFLATLLTVALGIACSPAQAAFPDQPINLVVPFSAGGTTDLDARAFATVAGKYLDQPMMVANKPGGSGIIGSQFVNMAKPDGITILCGRPGAQGVGTACFPETTPFTLDSFTFLGMIDMSPCVLMVRPDAPYKNLQELLDHIKANPGKLKYSSSGVNSIHNFATQYMLNLAGMKHDALIHVPYKGGGEALTAIMGGQVDMMFSIYSEAAAYLKAGTLKPLVILTKEPFPFAPEIPTCVDAGMPQLEFGTWFVLLGPKNISDDVCSKYWEVIQKVLADPDYQRMLADFGCIPTPMDGPTSRDYVVKQNEIYRNVGKAIGLVKK